MPVIGHNGQIPNRASLLMRYLDTNGDGTGVKVATGNYSATPTNFFIQPPIGQVFVANSFIMQLSDNGQFGQSVFGSMAGPLTNGVSMSFWTDSRMVVDLLDGIPIKTNDQFAHVSARVNLINWATSLNTMTVSWLAQDFGLSLEMVGKASDRLIVTLNDDLTSLVDFTFMVHGYSYPDPPGSG